MVKHATVCFAAIVALTGSAEAQTCTKGVNYCSINLECRAMIEYHFTLLSLQTTPWIRSYVPCAPDLARADSSLFRCLGGIKSNIGFEEVCRSGYVDGGANGPDHCYRDPTPWTGGGTWIQS